MPAVADLLGLGGLALATAAAVATLAARAGLSPRSCRASAAAAAAISLLPFGAHGFAAQLRGVLGDLSLTSLVLCARSLARRPRGLAGEDAADRLALAGLLAACGVLLYPLALGLGRVDPYRLGYGSPWLLVALLAIALGGVARDRPLVTTCVALAVAGWAVRLAESRNLWDYLLDPLACGWALLVLARRLPALRLRYPAAAAESEPVGAAGAGSSGRAGRKAPSSIH